MKRKILKNAMNKKYCGKTRFDYLDKEERPMIYKAMEEYHQAKLKLLGIANVVGRSEQLKCQCKNAKFTRTVDADFNPLCGRCGKAL